MGKSPAILRHAVAFGLAIAAVWAFGGDVPAVAKGVLPSLVTGEGVPMYLSAITRDADGVYWAVADRGGALYKGSIDIDTAASCIRTNEFTRVPGVFGDDLEGIAAHAGTIWVADESGPAIRPTGIGETLALPAAFSRCRPNGSLESLAVSPDGTTLWTANETPLHGDPANIVRIVKFTRPAGSGPSDWKSEAVYAYALDPLAGQPWRGRAANGLSDLAALADGRLVALEREGSQKGFVPAFRIRVYDVRTDAATDLHACDGPVPGDAVRAEKAELLFEMPMSVANFEGLCEGPALDDGRPTLVLVADGDGILPPMLALVAIPAKASR